MANKAVPSDEEKLVKRPWYRLHLSTWFLVLVATGLAAIMIVPGETDIEQVGHVYGGPSGNYGIFEESFRHGWPWEYYYRREAKIFSDSFENRTKAPWLVPRAWMLFDSDSNLNSFSYIFLMLDIVVGATIVLIATLLFEWRRRLRTRWFQFTLRELLSLLLIVAILLSWWRVHHNQRMREMEIASRFSDRTSWTDEYRGPIFLSRIFGTRILTDFNSYTRFAGLSFRSQQEANDLVSCLKEFGSLEEIDLPSSLDAKEEGNVFDEMLAEISTLKKLRSLTLVCAKITDAGMKTIANIPKLEELDVGGTEITSRGVQCLKSSLHLVWLDISGTKIDDGAGETLECLKNLVFLDLADTKITDQSVESLGRLTRLTSLDISNTRITEDGYQKLRSLLSECDIRYQNH
jgi:hypothetical protein